MADTMVSSSSRDTPLKTAAYREAGQAVAHHRLRGPRRYPGVLSLISYANGAGSFARDQDWSADAEYMQDTVVILCAGYTACVAAGVDEAAAKDACHAILAKAEKIIADWHVPSLAEHFDEAADLMWQPENRRAVARLADELYRHLLLLPQEIDVLIEVANGGISEAELARLRAVSLEQDRQQRLSYLSHTHQQH